MTSHIVTEPPKPGSEEWLRTLSASKVAAVFGASPWQSPYSLACQMKGLITPEAPNEKMQDIFDFGHAAEYGMADYWCRKNPGWEVTDGEVAYMNDSVPFPLIATVDRVATNVETGEKIVLEMKTAQSMDSIAHWGKPGTANSVPAHYSIQHLTQMGVSGIHRGVVILQGLGVPEFHTVDWNPLLWGRIVSQCQHFMDMLQSDELPPLDDTVATYDAVRGLHPDIDKDTVLVLTRELANELVTAQESKKKAEADLLGAKTKLMSIMGSMHRAVYDGHIIARRQAGRSGVSIVIKGTPEDIND